MLFIYYPFRNDKELKSNNPSTYRSKLEEPGVLDVLNKNYLLVEPFPTIADEVFERLNSDIHTTMNLYGQQENDEVNEKLAEHSEIF